MINGFPLLSPIRICLKCAFPKAPAVWRILPSLNLPVSILCVLKKPLVAYSSFTRFFNVVASVSSIEGHISPPREPVAQSHILLFFDFVVMFDEMDLISPHVALAFAKHKNVFTSIDSFVPLGKVVPE